MSKKILVSGGAGYIGNATVKFLLNCNLEVVVLDNLSTGFLEAVNKNVPFYEGDISDKELIKKICSENEIDSVIHFAASSLVAESVKNPALYYINNIGKTSIFFNELIKNGVKYFVFSSTAAIFGIPEEIPITENAPKNPLNTYGKTKLMIENMNEDYSKAYNVNVVNLRYFNACGAYEEAGESHDPETHLIPNILKGYLNNSQDITIFGNDYDTIDGTCVRDYIHIKDLANAHYLALQYMWKENKSENFNLGNGKGFSNLQILKAAEKVVGNKIPFKIGDRRPGDPPILIASSEKAKNLLNWEIEYTNIEDIIFTAYEWHKKYPNGYKKRIK